MNNVYHAQRQRRHDAQDSQWTTVQQLPARAQAGALFALWSEKLPKRVRRKMSTELLAQWRQLREIEQDRRMEEFHEFVDQLHSDMDERMMREAIKDSHREAIDDIRAVLESLPQLQSLTLVSNQDDHAIKVSMEEADSEGDRWDSIELFLAYVLETGGGITIRQRSPLRTQVRNAQGQMEWMNQERVYGIACQEGQWAMVSEADMRAAYNHDQQGNPLARDPTTIFGSLKDQARKVLGKRPKTFRNS